jgi:hypothetical protein
MSDSELALTFNYELCDLFIKPQALSIATGSTKTAMPGRILLFAECNQYLLQNNHYSIRASWDTVAHAPQP